MTPDEHRMLIETRALVEENSNILKSIQRVSRASLALKVIYWVVIIGFSFGAYYLVQPYVDAIKGASSDTGEAPSLNSFSPEKALENLKSLYE